MGIHVPAQTGDDLLLPPELRPVGSVVEALPEQPLQRLRVFDGVRLRDGIAHRQGRGPQPGQIQAQDRLGLFRRDEAQGQDRFDLSGVSVAERHAQAVFVPKGFARIAQDLREEVLVPRQRAAEGLAEVHVINRRAHDPAPVPPQAEGAPGIPVEFRMLIHPLEPGPVPVDMGPVAPVQGDEKIADRLIVGVAIGCEFHFRSPYLFSGQCVLFEGTGRMETRIPEGSLMRRRRRGRAIRRPEGGFVPTV